MNKPLVYIAGPYTKPDPIINTNRAIKVGLKLADTSLAAVEIPHLTMFAHLVEPREVDYWYAFDLDKLEHCQFLYRIAGASLGADREVTHARDHGIPVYLEEHSEWDRLVRALSDWQRAIPKVD